MVCGYIIGNISDPINITLYTTESTVKTPNDSLNPTESQGTHTSSTTETMGMNNLTSSQVYITSFSSLATALFMVAMVSLIVISIFLKRNKAKIRAVSVQSNRTEETTHNEQDYENVMLSPSPSVSAINTQDKVAYGPTRTSTRGAGATQYVPTYQNDTGPAGIISTQDNVAYGHTKTIAGAPQDVPMYEEVTDPIPLVSTIATQDNVAYGCTQQL